MTNNANRFGVPQLTDDQVKRLEEAAEIFAGGDEELLGTILEGTASHLQSLLSQNADEDAIANAVDSAEGIMPDLAFGEDTLVDASATASSDDDLAALLAEEDDGPDEFMGNDQKFTSLDELQDEELGGDDFDYESFQDEWN